MLPPRIRTAIEQHPALLAPLSEQGWGSNWKAFNRTAFDFIARRINRHVTARIVDMPHLLEEHVIIGGDQLNRLMTERQASTVGDLLQALTAMKKPVNWISGKTLQSYWNDGLPKETRLHVLLTYLQVPQEQWEEWKQRQHVKLPIGKPARRNPATALIERYFQGSYFLYYQKTDGSPLLIKAPFRIGPDHRGALMVETITEGHPYRSTSIELRDGILYIHCENQVFDEKENHIFNVGNETDPQVLFGVSNTITVKQKLAVGLRNVLIKQRRAFTAETFREYEIPLTGTPSDEEDQMMVRYFNQQQVNQLQSRHCCTKEVLLASL